MKCNIDGVIVVEGSNDASFVSSVVNALIFITNGYDINIEKLNFLKEVSKVNKIIILTDNDKAGSEIRNKIKKQIPDAVDVILEKGSRKNYKKSGVAESKIDNLIKGIKPYITSKEVFNEEYDLLSLISLSKNQEEKREEIIKKYKLVRGNNKSIENQLRMLKITKEQLWK